MARNRRNSSFTAIRIEGGILPPEFLNVVAAQEAKHQTGADYGLTKSLTLKDELARYWRIANDLYTAYAERRERTDLSPIKVGVDDWLVSLLKEVLGFSDVALARSVAVGDRTFTITHQAFGGAVPVLLTTREFELDRADPRFGEDGRRRAPHGLMQELLNASDDALWGIVANGAKLRLLRDNPSLTRPAYIEADLDLIFAEQLYPDFAALWLLGHATRLKPVDDKASGAILERWRAEAHETGERALQHLREGVTEALRQLGNGFLQHPHNEGLRAALSDGTLSAERYFQELLRLVYRLLFLFTAEERSLLHIPDATDDQRAIYTQGYSLARLRDRALKRRHYDRHHDLWQGVKLVFSILSRGEPALSLPALGGLFATEQCANLEAGLISNERLLEAVRALAYFRSGSALARVNYRDMGTEELGSVYESLLELHPVIDVDAAPWTFGFVGESNGEKTKGSERKLTGSYYTPAPLVNELIKTALEPVMSEAVKSMPGDPRGALLGLKIVDPACGSGHFLLAAARRVAAEIARIEAGSDTPDEAARQHALREVVQHCIYGVDRNPLAVELCRTALWIETVEPGKPLTFLDPHIQCGDSLVGILDPAIMADGIPDDAYKELAGDEKAVCRDLKKRNRDSGSGVQGTLFDRDSLRTIAVATAALDEMPEETLKDIETKRAAWEAAKADASRKQAELKADLFVGAFFAPKTHETFERVPLSEDLNRVTRGMAIRPGVEAFTRELAHKHLFFHWHLAFAEVMEKGGFDVVLGNPPWEKTTVLEREFFAAIPAIANENRGNVRKRQIQELAGTNPRLYQAWIDALYAAAAINRFIRGSSAFPLTASGELNLYPLFAERSRQVLHEEGRCGLVVKTNLLNAPTWSAFTSNLLENNAIVSAYDFRNWRGWFPAVGYHERFTLLTITKSKTSTTFSAGFYLDDPDQIKDSSKVYELSTDDVTAFNPTTKTLACYETKKDKDILVRIGREFPVLGKGSGWTLRYTTGFHMTNDSASFVDFESLLERGFELNNLSHMVKGSVKYLPLCEGKFIHQYDHRFASFEGIARDKRFGIKAATYSPTEKDKARTDYEIIPRYWVDEETALENLNKRGLNGQWGFTFRDTTNVISNFRTAVATIVGPWCFGNKAPNLVFNAEHPEREAALFLSIMNSFAFDYILRQKFYGANLTKSILMEVQVPQRADLDRHAKDLQERVLELTFTSASLCDFAKNMNSKVSVFGFDSERRRKLKAEIDVLVFDLYGFPKEEAEYVMSTFRILREREEENFGTYRTKDLVLEAWDRLERGTIDELAPVIPLPRHAPEPLPLPDIAAAGDGAWARPITNPRGETMEVLLAALQAMDGPRPSERVRLAALLAMEPHLLMPHLDPDQAHEWSRVVGDETDGPTHDSAKLDEHWGAAVRHFRSRDWLEESGGNWGPGTLPTNFQAGEWAIGRVAIAWDAMRSIGEKAEVISLFSEQLDRWRNAEAA